MEALPGVLGIQGEGLFIFRNLGNLGRTVILFSGIWGESITFWGFREQRAEEKHFRELGRKVIFFFFREQSPPPPHPPSGGLTMDQLSALR